MNTGPAIHFQEKKPDQSFRDSLATVDAKGRRKWVFAQKPDGRFYNIRSYVSWFFFAIFFTLPFIYVNEQPLISFQYTGCQIHFVQ